MMNISERCYLAGAFVVILAGVFGSTWTAHGPRLGAIANAAPRHRVPAQHGQAVSSLLQSAPEPPSPVAPTRVWRVKRTHAPATAVLSFDVPDLPEPGPHAPLLWDDMFPAPPRSANGTNGPSARPCFDRLQGIEGLSPCPAVTPR